MLQQMWLWFAILACIHVRTTYTVPTTSGPVTRGTSLRTGPAWTTGRTPKSPPAATPAVTTVSRASAAPSSVAPPRTAPTLLPSAPTSSIPLPPDEYYSTYQDYSENLPPLNATGEGVLVPRLVGEGPGVAASLRLPDDSLADTDLHDHDLIDSVMYIYFGASAADQRAPGRQVLIVGAVVGQVAQFLTLAGGCRRARTKHDPSLAFLLNTELALTVTNLLFMLGVQATGEHCEAVAVCLHYLHLVVSSWFCANCLHAYARIVRPHSPPPLPLYVVLTWTLPAIPTLCCVWLDREAYESRQFCWLSEKGLLFPFLVPTVLLILVSGGCAVGGLRAKAADCEAERRSLRMATLLLPTFSLVWFLGVVALQHPASLVLPLLFVAASGFLNWFVFICWLPREAGVWRGGEDELEEDLEEELYCGEGDCCKVDDQPLLQEVVSCGRRPLGPYDPLQMDPIATISS